MKHEGYWLVLKPGHPQADKDNYVRENRVIYEEYHKCCLLRWTIVHHDDGDKENNDIDNLILTSIWEHHNKFHREDFGVVCKCGSKDVNRKGLDTSRSKQKFSCKNCGQNWRISLNDLQNMVAEYRAGIRQEIRAPPPIRRLKVDFGQICTCGNTDVIRRGKVNRGLKQVFYCKRCKKSWGVPISDLPSHGLSSVKRQIEN